MARLLLLFALATPAQAQYFAGISVSRTSNSAQVAVVPTAYVATTVASASREYAWGLWSLLENNADSAGESVAVYGQAYKYGLAPTWGLVAEAQCPNGNGAGCFGAEVDVMASGLSGGPRWGIQLVVGKARGAVPGPAAVDVAIDVVAMGNVREDVQLRRGLSFGLPCTQNCVQIPAGSTVNLGGGDPAASLMFDAHTGYMGFCNKRTGQWAWRAQMDTREVGAGEAC